MRQTNIATIAHRKETTMQTDFSSRSMTVSLCFGLFLLSGAAMSQELKIGEPNKEALCPHPATLQLQATAAPSINAQDFPNPLPAGQGVRVLNQAGTNQVFRYTFNWKVSEKLCCSITKGKLTVHFKWAPGAAGNDSVGIVHAGSSVAGQGGYIWGGAGTAVATVPYTGPALSPKTVVIDLNAASLQNASQDNRLSFGMQDDTTIESAVLEISGCCVDHHK
jgi:hypothetical protein